MIPFTESTIAHFILFQIQTPFIHVYSATIRMFYLLVNCNIDCTMFKMSFHWALDVLVSHINGRPLPGSRSTQLRDGIFKVNLEKSWKPSEQYHRHANGVELRPEHHAGSSHYQPDRLCNTTFIRTIYCHDIIDEMSNRIQGLTHRTAKECRQPQARLLKNYSHVCQFRPCLTGDRSKPSQREPKGRNPCGVKTGNHPKGGTLQYIEAGLFSGCLPLEFICQEVSLFQASGQSRLPNAGSGASEVMMILRDGIAGWEFLNLTHDRVANGRSHGQLFIPSFYGPQNRKQFMDFLSNLRCDGVGVSLFYC